MNTFFKKEEQKVEGKEIKRKRVFPIKEVKKKVDKKQNPDGIGNPIISKITSIRGNFNTEISLLSNRITRSKLKISQFEEKSNSKAHLLESHQEDEKSTMITKGNIRGNCDFHCECALCTDKITIKYK